MEQRNSFKIQNDFGGDLLIVVEPNGATETLPKGSAFDVFEVFEREPMTIVLAQSIFGMPEIAFWCGDGSLRIEMDGKVLIKA
jgi:hypothetical protein